MSAILKIIATFAGVIGWFINRGKQNRDELVGSLKVENDSLKQAIKDGRDVDNIHNEIAQLSDAELDERLSQRMRK